MKLVGSWRGQYRYVKSRIDIIVLDLFGVLNAKYITTGVHTVEPFITSKDLSFATWPVGAVFLNDVS